MKTSDFVDGNTFHGFTSTDQVPVLDKNFWSCSLCIKSPVRAVPTVAKYCYISCRSNAFDLQTGDKVLKVCFFYLILIDTWCESSRGELKG